MLHTCDQFSIKYHVNFNANKSNLVIYDVDETEDDNDKDIIIIWNIHFFKCHVAILNKRPAGHHNPRPARVIEILQGAYFPEGSHYVLQ